MSTLTILIAHTHTHTHTHTEAPTHMNILTIQTTKLNLHNIKWEVNTDLTSKWLIVYTNTDHNNLKTTTEKSDKSVMFAALEL